MEKQLYIMVNIETEIISFLFYYLLFKASGQENLEVVRLLINNERCNINEKVTDGYTALHLGEYLN
jgi:hypothetical protein